MTLNTLYEYLIKARRELWRVLETVPDEILSKPLLQGERSHCVKDLIFHIADVEDGWVHGDIRNEPWVQHSIPEIRDSPGGAAYADFPLASLLAYWQLVEQSTLTVLDQLTDDERHRRVISEGFEQANLTVERILWHVMLHEVRHTAQICTLLRLQGIQPPALDLVFL